LEENRPTIVRVHATTNGMLQNAFASFVVYSLYKDMFRRGPLLISVPRATVPLGQAAGTQALPQTRR
jgi:hypothetical protein